MDDLVASMNEQHLYLCVANLHTKLALELNDKMGPAINYGSAMLIGYIQVDRFIKKESILILHFFCRCLLEQQLGEGIGRGRGELWCI